MSRSQTPVRRTHTTPRAVRRIPNALSLLRLALLPPLWVLALLGRNVLLAIGIALAISTDIADGLIARRTGSTSRTGSQLDSIADLLLMGSVCVWLLLLRPDFVHQNAVWLLVWLAIAMLALLVGWLRFRRIGDLHLHTTRAASLCAYLFVLGLLADVRYPPVVAPIVIALATLASLEALLVMSLLDRVDERIGSIVSALRRRARQTRGREMPR